MMLELVADEVPLDPRSRCFAPTEPVFPLVRRRQASLPDDAAAAPDEDGRFAARRIAVRLVGCLALIGLVVGTARMATVESARRAMIRWATMDQRATSFEALTKGAE
jgi:hypothetical protein